MAWKGAGLRSDDQLQVQNSRVSGHCRSIGRGAVQHSGIHCMLSIYSEGLVSPLHSILIHF